MEHPGPYVVAVLDSFHLSDCRHDNIAPTWMVVFHVVTREVLIIGSRDVYSKGCFISDGTFEQRLTSLYYYVGGMSWPVRYSEVHM